MKFFFVIILFLISFSFSDASDSLKTVDARDTSKVVNQSDTAADKSTEFQMAKSPTGAVLRSLALPGWGQIYVESYWKAPLLIGGAGTLVYLIIDNNIKFVDAKKDVDKLISNQATDYEITRAKNIREYYRDNRDMCAFFLAGVYIIAAVDAYVGAHLFDFNVNEDLSVNWKPFINSNVINNNAKAFNVIGIKIGISLK